MSADNRSVSAVLRSAVDKIIRLINPRRHKDLKDECALCLEALTAGDASEGPSACPPPLAYFKLLKLAADSALPKVVGVALDTIQASGSEARLLNGWVCEVRCIRGFWGTACC